jgi:hypothetical protein
MGQPALSGLPFNSFIGNVALENLVERMKGVPFSQVHYEVGEIFKCVKNSQIH